MAELDGVHISIEAGEASIAWSSLGGRYTPFQEQLCQGADVKMQCTRKQLPFVYTRSFFSFQNNLTSMQLYVGT